MLKKIVILIILSTCLFAQLPYEFTHLAHSPYGENSSGITFDVDVSANKTIFLADYRNGLIAYAFNPELGTLTKITMIKEDDASYSHIDVMNDSTVFVLDHSVRLICYRFRDNCFSKITELYATSATGVNAVNDSTILLSCGQNGLKIIHFDGTDLSVRAEDDREGQAQNAEMLNDSTLLLANGSEGLYAYHYSDSTLEYISHIISAGSKTYLEYAYDVKITHEDTIFLANGQEGLYAYTFNDSSFIYHASSNDASWISSFDVPCFSNIEIGLNDNTIYVAGGQGGLYVYHYSDLTFSEIDNNYGDDVYALAKIYENMIVTADGTKGARVFFFSGSALNIYDKIANDTFARRLDLDKYGRIFLANGGSGILACEFNGTEFISLAQIYNAGYANDIAVTSDGSTVFVANGRDGIRVYSFDGESFTLLKHVSPDASPYESYWKNDDIGIDMISDSQIVVVHQYDYQDNMSSRTFSYGSAVLKTWDGIDFSESSEIFLYPSDYYGALDIGGMISDVDHFTDVGWIAAIGSRGISDGSDIVTTGGNVLDIDILSDGSLLAACDGEGMKSYIYNEGFLLEYEINDGGHAKQLFCYDSLNILLANGDDGLRAYSRSDTSFACRAHIDSGGTAMDIAILPDSTIILANGEDGLRAYTYDGFLSSGNSNTDIPTAFTLYENYPNPFNPLTTIKYDLLDLCNVQMIIYDIVGRKIKQWSYQNQNAGTYELTWNGKDQAGNQMPSGVYIYRLVTSEFVKSRKMVLLK